MKRSKSSRQWLNRHINDPFVQEAQRMGWRSRAVFKLKEIQEKDKLIKPGMNIVDLGAAPGGWSQYVGKLLQGRGQIFALDLLPMDPLANVDFIQGDFLDDAILQQLNDKLAGKQIDLVLSDMAPNMTGIKSADQARVMYLAEIALEFVTKTLAPTGAFLVKVFQGEGFDAYLKLLRQTFKKVVIRKPKASRDESAEVYLLALGLK